MRSSMFGFTGTGKSHVLALLLDEEPPFRRVSTAVAKVPVRVRAVDFVKMGMTFKVFKRISESHYSAMVMKTVRNEVYKLKLSGFEKFQEKVTKMVYTPPLPTDEVGKDLMEKLCESGEDVMTLEDQTLGEMSDCGGQPQFLEVLPLFIENISLGILVTDLSQRLDDYPITNYYNEQGRPVGEGVRYSLTNDQVLRLCMRMIASQARGSRRLRFIFVGTHRDMEGGCTQSRQDKNQRLMEMVESFGLEDRVIYKNRDRKELIFAVNARIPEEDDKETAAELRELMMDPSAARIVSFPLSYYGVELTLKNKVRESGHIAFRESDLLKELSHFHLTKRSLKDALRYLHEIKVIFYFEKEFPGVVIGEPQSVLNKHTEVVAYHIELSTNPYLWRSIFGIWKKFCEMGILTIECLEKFPDHYVEGVFSPADMMRLLKKLLIVSEVGDGEYLMPCVLRADPQAQCNTEPETQSAPPMVLHFPGGPVRYGIFCSTICYVMTKGKWKLFKTDHSFHITRNSVHFSLPGFPGKVTVNDPLDSFFLVTIHIPRSVPAYDATLSCMCVEVRKTLLRAINKATKNLNYIPDTPEVAFLCDAAEHRKSSLYPARVSVLRDSLLCTKDDGVYGGVVKDEHRVWLKDYKPSLAHPVHSGSDAPVSSPLPPRLSPYSDTDFAMPSSLPPRSPQSPAHSSVAAPLSLKSLNLLKWRDEFGCDQIFRLAQRVGAQWEEFGMLLNIERSQLKIWRGEKLGNMLACWNEVMDYWLNTGGTTEYPRTWEGLYSLLTDLEMESVAQELKKAVSRA